MTGIRQPANGWLRLASPTHRLVGTVTHQAGVYLLPTGASLDLPTGPASTAALLAAFTTGCSRYPFTVGRNFVKGGGEPRPGRSTTVLTSPVRAKESAAWDQHVPGWLGIGLRHRSISAAVPADRTSAWGPWQCRYQYGRWAWKPPCPAMKGKPFHTVDPLSVWRKDGSRIKLPAKLHASLQKVTPGTSEASAPARPLRRTGITDASSLMTTGSAIADRCG